MAPHLLKLPAEIRNLIYEYALTQEDGILYFHEDWDWVGRLFLEEEEPYAVLQFRYHEQRLSQTDNKCFDQKYLRARSRLARLIPNQLQFVCHQLHYETGDLSTKYNTIVFANIRYESETANSCVRFLERTKLPQWDFIQACIMYTGEVECGMRFFLARLFSFCKMHPRSRINLHLQVMDDPLIYIDAAHFLHMMFGKEFPFLPHRSISAIEYCRSCESYNHMLADVQRMDVPSNFRIFPSMTEFDEDCFRLDIENDRGWIRHCAELRSSADVDSFVAWAKDFWENGV